MSFLVLLLAVLGVGLATYSPTWLDFPWKNVTWLFLLLTSHFTMGASLLFISILALWGQEEARPWSANAFLSLSWMFAYPSSPLRDSWVSYEEPTYPPGSNSVSPTIAETLGSSPAIPLCAREMPIIYIHWFSLQGSFGEIIQTQHLDGISSHGALP
jgi:hypothetical protein